MQAPVTDTGAVFMPPPKTDSGLSDQHPPMPMRSQSGAIDPTNSGERGIKDNAVKSCGSCGLTGHQAILGTGSGADIEREIKGLMLAIGKLTPTDRDTLIRMIREYLTIKGIDLAQFAEKRAEIKEVKKETQTAITEIRNTTQDAARAKREEMRKKIIENRTGSGTTR
jgi:hypothetical protein